MPTASYTRSFALGGYAFANQGTSQITFDHTNTYEVSLPAGKVVTNWVKTDANTAACDLPAGHGYTNGNFDVYFPAGVRYGVPGTISTNALTLDGGAGTDFPASATSGVVVTKQVEISTAIDGDDVKALGIFFRSTDTAAVGHIDFQDSGNASIEAFDLDEVDNSTAGMDHAYGTTAAVALLTGNPITKAFATNGSSTASATIYILVGEDTTP